LVALVMRRRGVAKPPGEGRLSRQRGRAYASANLAASFRRLLLSAGAIGIAANK